MPRGTIWATETHRYCNKCNRWKTHDKFFASYQGNQCKICRQAIRWKLDYGATEEEIEVLLYVAEHGCSCDICGIYVIGKKLHVDHCHKTNRVRGVLCWACNDAMGKFRDNREIMLKAVDYLDSFCTTV